MKIYRWIVSIWRRKKREEKPVLGNADSFKISLPLVRRMYPSLMSCQLVGVQPLSGPSGLVTYMRYKYSTHMTEDFQRFWPLIDVGYAVIKELHETFPESISVFDLRACGDAMEFMIHVRSESAPTIMHVYYHPNGISFRGSFYDYENPESFRAFMRDLASNIDYHQPRNSVFNELQTA